MLAASRAILFRMPDPESLASLAVLLFSEYQTAIGAKLLSHGNSAPVEGLAASSRVSRKKRLHSKPAVASRPMVRPTHCRRLDSPGAKRSSASTVCQYPANAAYAPDGLAWSLATAVTLCAGLMVAWASRTLRESTRSRAIKESEDELGAAVQRAAG